METNECKTITPPLKHVIAIKLGKKELYPKYLLEWLEVYFYFADEDIKNILLAEMEKCKQPGDIEVWEKLYFSTKDEDIKRLAFKILPNKKGFNKEFICYKNSLSDLGEEKKTTIDRYTLSHNIGMLRGMLKNYETLDDLMLILSSAREMDQRANIFHDSDLRFEISQIPVAEEILKYITSCDIDLNIDFAPKSEDKKLCLLDLNNLCKRFSIGPVHEKIIEIIKNNLDRDFDNYIRLYLNEPLDYEISKIILSKIKSSESTLESLVKVFENTKSSGPKVLRDYSLEEIIKKFENFECNPNTLDNS